MSRIMLIEVRDTQTEDALQYLLALARDARSDTQDGQAAFDAVAALSSGIDVLYSAPVGKP